MNRQDIFSHHASEWKSRIANAHSIMLLTHVNPDGDAIGSLIGLLSALPQITNARLIPVIQQPIPPYLAWLPDVNKSIALDANSTWPHPDLIIAVDCASSDRFGGLHPKHRESLLHTSMIQIDHHATNTQFALQNLIIPKACATCEIITEFLPYLGITITAGIATPLLLGIMTDTQSFQIYDTRAETLQLGAKLFSAGADHQQIVEKVFRSTRLDALKLASRVISEMTVDGPIVWAAISLEMLNTHQASDDESDEALQMLQRIDGFEIIMLIKEREQGVKISLRSRNVIVAGVAQKHGGGGHAHAAGINLPNHTIVSAAALLLPDLQALCMDSSASTSHSA
ncbi:MAG: DHH family phosphoesterase [Chloroflexales bacterium]|nr:DHH family phosphoesterase [Chloroflexales bacterium]